MEPENNFTLKAWIENNTLVSLIVAVSTCAVIIGGVLKNWYDTEIRQAQGKFDIEIVACSKELSLKDAEHNITKSELMSLRRIYSDIEKFNNRDSNYESWQNELARNISLEIDAKIKAAARNNNNLNNSNSKPAYNTGLIVDCKGLDLKPKLLPSIVVEDETILYSINNGPSREQVLKDGFVGYTDSVQKAALMVDKVGTNPLVIRAIDSYREKGSPIVSKNDAKIVYSANIDYGFFKQGKVVFVLGDDIPGETIIGEGFSSPVQGNFNRKGEIEASKTIVSIVSAINEIGIMSSGIEPKEDVKNKTIVLEGDIIVSNQFRINFAVTIKDFVLIRDKIHMQFNEVSIKTNMGELVSPTKRVHLVEHQLKRAVRGSGLQIIAIETMADESVRAKIKMEL